MQREKKERGKGKARERTKKGSYAQNRKVMLHKHAFVSLYASGKEGRYISKLFVSSSALIMQLN